MSTEIQQTMNLVSSCFRNDLSCDFQLPTRRAPRKSHSSLAASAVRNKRPVRRNRHQESRTRSNKILHIAVIAQHASRRSTPSNHVCDTNMEDYTHRLLERPNESEKKQPPCQKASFVDLITLIFRRRRSRRRKSPFYPLLSTTLPIFFSPCARKDPQPPLPRLLHSYLRPARELASVHSSACR
jgi:hypothetical protein